nr:N-acetylmuramoyl-L-alanine amidase [Oscillospiraceae bacterium]
MIRICLDAGHGEGYNPSPCGYGYKEGTRMFEYQSYLKEALEQYEDVEVVCTREKVSDDPSLFGRAQRAQGSHLLLSLHSNAAGNGVYEGTDYVAVFASVYADNDMLNLANRIAGAVTRVMDPWQAWQVHQKWNSTHTADWMGVIRHACNIGVPALLIEHSFHTDSRITRWLMEDGNLKALAAAEAAAIAVHYGLRKEENEVRYKTIADMKADKTAQTHYLPTIEKLLANGVLQGREGEGDSLVLDLSEDAVRLLVILDRAGVFDK